MTPDNQRGYFRIEYPLWSRPTFAVGGREAIVLDCSESGLRCAWPESEPVPAVGTRIEGRVQLHEGRSVDAVGEVVWTDGTGVALRWTEAAIPFQVILDEQRYLRRRHPGFFDAR